MTVNSHENQIGLLDKSENLLKLLHQYQSEQRKILQLDHSTRIKQVNDLTSDTKTNYDLNSILPTVTLERNIFSSLIDLLRNNVNIFFNEMIRTAYKSSITSPSTEQQQVKQSNEVNNSTLGLNNGSDDEKKHGQHINQVLSAITESREPNSTNSESNSNNSNSTTSGGGGNNNPVNTVGNTVGVGQGDLPHGLSKPTGLEPPRPEKPNQVVNNSVALVTSTGSLLSEHQKGSLPKKSSSFPLQ